MKVAEPVTPHEGQHRAAIQCCYTNNIVFETYGYDLNLLMGCIRQAWNKARKGQPYFHYQNYYIVGEQYGTINPKKAIL